MCQENRGPWSKKFENRCFVTCADLSPIPVRSAV